MKRGSSPRVEENEDILVMSIRLESGRFSSEIRVPLFANEADKERFVEQWFKMMEAGIACGRSHRNTVEDMKRGMRDDNSKHRGDESDAQGTDDSEDS